MIIECLVKRTGRTVVPMAGVDYTFWPIPGAKKDEFTTSVCEVTKESHLEYLLGNEKKGINPKPQFREYEEERSHRELIESRNSTSPFMGFSLQKYMEAGYVVADSRKKGHVLYAGADGQWKEQRVNMTPFGTELQAWEWLRDELEFQGTSAIEPEAEPEKIKEPDKGRPGRTSEKRAIDTLAKITG